MIFYFTIRGLFVLKNFCPDFLGVVENQVDKKAKADFKIYDVISWGTNNCNTYIAQYLKCSLHSQQTKESIENEHQT